MGCGSGSWLRLCLCVLGAVSVSVYVYVCECVCVSDCGVGLEAHVCGWCMCEGEVGRERAVQNAVSSGRCWLTGQRLLEIRNNRAAYIRDAGRQGSIYKTACVAACAGDWRCALRLLASLQHLQHHERNSKSFKRRAEEDARHVMQDHDSDGDGKVSLQE